MTHADRRRADSFGAAAERYDRARPGYPDALFDDLVGGSPRRVLDVGCGTGIASAALVARGCDVLGVEPDARMAEVAQRKGVPVEISKFEDWDPAGRTFELIVSAQAWHWVEPTAGLDAAARCLEPGGVLGMFWNVVNYDDATRARLQAVYAEHAPSLVNESVAVGSIDRTLWVEHAEALTRHTALGRGRTRTYDWTQRYSAEQWTDNVGTHSDHALLPPDVRERVFDALHRTIDEMGGTLEVKYTTVLVSTDRVTSG